MTYATYKHCLVWQGQTSLEQELAPSRARALMKRSRALMLRNCWDWDCPGQTRFWEIIQDRHRDIAELPPKVRNMIRRCLRDCRIERISAHDLVAADGFGVYRQAFSRYRDIADSIESRREWESRVSEDRDSEYWGVFTRSEDKLIAWAQNEVKGRMVFYSVLKAVPEYMNRHYPYYGLLYEMGHHYLQERGMDYVSDGWRSITEHSGIQPFLEQKFLFRRAYCRMRLHLHPLLRLALAMLHPLRDWPRLPLKARYLLHFRSLSEK